MLMQPIRTVNTEAVMELADFVASEVYSFDMDNAHANPVCGTAGCIGGHAAALWEEVRNFGEPLLKEHAFSFSEPVLAEKLGVTEVDIVDLCYGYPGNVTREQAVRVLRHLALTGEVNWRVRNKG